MTDLYNKTWDSNVTKAKIRKKYNNLLLSKRKKAVTNNTHFEKYFLLNTVVSIALFYFAIRGVIWNFWKGQGIISYFLY